MRIWDPGWEKFGSGMEKIRTWNWNLMLSLKTCTIVNSDPLPSLPCHSSFMWPGFRLWITTEINSCFPLGLLQMSIKYTNDPPQGIRASLKVQYAPSQAVRFFPDFLPVLWIRITWIRMRIRIQLITLIRIRIRIQTYIWCGGSGCGGPGCGSGSDFSP